MKVFLSSIIISLILFSQGVDAQYGKNWASFPIDSLEEVLNKSGKNWLPFVEKLSMDCGLYKLEVGEEDMQEPHRLDETYYVLKGKAILDIKGTKQPVKEGSLLYIPAMSGQKFEEITEYLLVMIFFSKKTPKPSREPSALS